MLRKLTSCLLLTMIIGCGLNKHKKPVPNTVDGPLIKPIKLEDKREV